MGVENGLVVGLLCGLGLGVVITIIGIFSYYPAVDELHNSRWVSREYGWRSWFKYAWTHYIVWPLSLVGLMEFPDD